MPEYLPNLPRHIQQTPDGPWQGADHPDGPPWRSIAPQQALPWKTDGPLSKSDMETIWARQRRPADTGLVCSIGPAVDLPQLERAMDEFSRQPWIQPPQGGEGMA